MRATAWKRIRAAGRKRSARRACALAAATALAALTAAPGASAAPSQTTIFDIGGAVFSVPTAKRMDQLDEVQAMGVDTIRIVASWREIAPSPGSRNKPTQFTATDPGAYPGFGWGPIDDLVRGATARGIKVLLTPSGPVPDWASATGESRTRPDPGEFQKFVTAVGTRYSGRYDPSGNVLNPNPLPRVSFWSIWNEPNLTLFLKPQFQGNASVSGKIYRRLFLAAQRGLAASSHGGDPILIGETSPGPGRGGTAPIDFMRGVFCLRRNFKPRGGCAPINATGWAQHPYDPYDPPFRTTRNLITIDTIGKLTRALKRAAAAGAANRLPIFVTEYGVESVPDRQFGVGQKRQAEYIGIAEYLCYRNPRIRSFGQYLLRDDGGGLQFSFQTGLRFNGGAKKAAYDAFSLTLAAKRKSRRSGKVTIWGHVRPAARGVPVDVLAKDGRGKEKDLRSLMTDSNGYFQFVTRFRRGRQYRAVSRLNAERTVESILQRVYVFR
jgi:hypothetical protein